MTAALSAALPTGCLVVKNVSLRLGRSPRFLLQDISFEMQPGEVTVLLGSPGSGKTLLLQLLNGLKSPSQGEIQWQGKALAEQSPMALRRQIAWLPQQPRLLGMTGKEAIAYPLKLQGLTSIEIQQRLDPWLDLLTLPLPWLEQRGEMLSQSAAQAIALVRALVLEPQLLLLDNPWPQSLDRAAFSRSAAAPQPGEASDLPVWNNPKDQINLALSKFTKAGGAVIWAMTPNEGVTTEAIAMANRILQIAEGRVIGNYDATSTLWQQALTELATAFPTQKSESEADAEWD